MRLSFGEGREKPPGGSAALQTGSLQTNPGEEEQQPWRGRHRLGQAPAHSGRGKGHSTAREPLNAVPVCLQTIKL